MGESKSELKCLNCGSSEMEIPLISARYAGEQLWICSRCMPVLIHKPEQLIGTLKGADKIPPAPHHH
jgi:hypothetical protein